MTSTAGWSTDTDPGVRPAVATAPVQQERQRESKRADIQGLRAIAVVLVVIYHAKLPLPAGFAGVDVFFVISGFVITGQIERLRSSGRFGFGSFYARRIRRLLPAMVVMLLAVLLLSFLFQSPIGAQSTTAGTALAAVLLAGNFDLLSTSGDYFAAGAVMNPLTHVWSLSVEEQFYLVFPLLLALTWKFGRGGARSQAIGLGLLTAASFALSMWLSYGDFRVHSYPASDVAFYSSPTRAWEFGVGALLAVWASKRAARHYTAERTVLPVALGAAGLALLVYLNLRVNDQTVWPGVAAIVPVVATALLILAGTVGEGPIKRVLSSRPFVVTGDLSYSIYLWHWPAIVIATLIWPRPYTPVLAALFSLLPAYLSYRFVEQPLRHGGVRLPRVYLGGAVAAGTVVVAAVTLQVAGPWAVPNAAAYAGQRGELTFGRENGCLVRNRSFEAADFDRCMDTVPNAKGWVMLAGDSHAEAYSTGLIEADRRLGYSTLALTGASCPLMRDAQPSREVANCGELASALLDRATKSDDPPSLVVVGQWALARHDVDGKWPQQLKPALQELTEAGIPVLYVMDVPNYATQAMNRQTACSGGFLNFVCDKSQEDVLEYQGTSRQAEWDVVTSVPGVSVYDPWDRFCNGDVCSPLVDGELAYWDFNHLNRIGSQALTDDLKTAVGAIL
ncbi:acyltransferase [Kineosporia sp. NBRC 101677]|uniref:acyltransferase family protein n=1 Tax=Kineosporia sp. NBRC 101677 TaxID=3032197 RepID=UPI0024A2EAC8|nr:acyltransferase family protein [Kineosporia sp. NBRC 101677]GLY17763.1 acyltransferase [Kineosporia sp. NBRC 101677]